MWMRNSVIIFAGINRIQYSGNAKLSQSNYSLIIGPLQAIDEGVYRCFEFEELLIEHCIEIAGKSCGKAEVKVESILDNNLLKSLINAQLLPFLQIKYFAKGLPHFENDRI